MCVGVFPEIPKKINQFQGSELKVYFRMPVLDHVFPGPSIRRISFKFTFGSRVTREITGVFVEFPVRLLLRCVLWLLVLLPSFDFTCLAWSPVCFAAFFPARNGPPPARL